MLEQQRRTGVDLNEEGYTKEYGEQQRHMQTYQNALPFDVPVNERFVAQQYGSQTQMSRQAVNQEFVAGFQQINSQLVVKNQGFTAPNNFAGYYQTSVNFGLNAANIAAASAATAKNAVARNYQMDRTTDDLVAIIDGTKKNRKEKGKGKNQERL